MSDRPTKEERALPPRKGCESCAHLYGDQAPDPLEQEVDRLRGDLEKLRTIAIETAEHYRTERDEARAALRARDAENEAKAAVIAAMEHEVAAGKKALSDMVWKAARQIVGEVDNERETIAEMADAKAKHHAVRAEQQSRGGPALHRKAAGSYRAFAAAIRARGGK